MFESTMTALFWCLWIPLCDNECGTRPEEHINAPTGTQRVVFCSQAMGLQRPTG